MSSRQELGGSHSRLDPGLRLDGCAPGGGNKDEKHKGIKLSPRIGRTSTYFNELFFGYFICSV